MKNIREINLIIGFLISMFFYHQAEAACTSPYETTTYPEPETPPFPDKECSCNFDSFACNPGECSGRCSIRNSRCGGVWGLDYLYCSCLYCNYNSMSGKCEGVCDNESRSCISTVAVPKSDSDCSCSSCGGIGKIGTNGELICQGDCFESGLKCKGSLVQAPWSSKPEDKIAVCRCSS